MKLGLGTVQFGCNYGISNKKGQVPYEEIRKILEYAQEVGIDTLDTASLYGNSEKVLGRFNIDNFKVVTKAKPSAEMIEDMIFAWKIAKHADKMNKNRKKFFIGQKEKNDIFTD